MKYVTKPVLVRRKWNVTRSLSFLPSSLHRTDFYNFILYNLFENTYFSGVFFPLQFHRQQVEMKFQKSESPSISTETATPINSHNIPSSGRNSERSTPGLTQANNPDDEGKDVTSSPGAVEEYLEKQRNLPQSELSQALGFSALDQIARQNLDAELAKCKELLGDSEGLSSSESGKICNIYTGTRVIVAFL